MDWGGRTTWDGFRQADPLASVASSWSSFPQMYGYGSRPSSGWGIDYDPTYSRGSMTYAPASNFSWLAISNDIDSWMYDPIDGEYRHLIDFSSPGGGGDVSQSGQLGQFHQDPTVYAEIGAAANKYGVPANLLKAMIARESSGHWGAGPNYDNTQLTWLPSRNQWIAGYTGITEAAANAWGYNIHDFAGNRALQIDAMANGLARLYGDVGDQYGWEGVINTYYSGDPTGGHTPGDSYQYGTTNEYTRDVMSWWQQEDAWTQQHGGSVGSGFGGGFGAEGGPRGPVAATEATWGGHDFPITQTHGYAGPWVQQNPGMYAYSYDLLGHLGHPGIDVGMPIGTNLYAPVSGTVIAAGGTGYFRHDPVGNSPGTGELRIRLDNGDEVILGHMAGINVRVGDRVSPGQHVGASGSAGSGAHLHLEYRTPRADGSWAAVDPFEALGGGMVSLGASSGGYSPAPERPMTFNELMRAGAMGRDVSTGTVRAAPTTNTWNSFLQNAMRGGTSFGGRARFS